MAPAQTCHLSLYNYVRFVPDRGAPPYMRFPAASRIIELMIMQNSFPVVVPRSMIWISFSITDRLSISQSNLDADKIVGTSSEYVGAPTPDLNPS